MKNTNKKYKWKPRKNVHLIKSKELISLKFICNPQINSHSALAIICIHAQSGENLNCSKHTFPAEVKQGSALSSPSPPPPALVSALILWTTVLSIGYLVPHF